MRPLRFLLPGTSSRFRCGGLLVELQTARLTARLAPTEIVTYRQKEPDHPFWGDLIRREPAPGRALWVVSWGFDVPRLLRRLSGRPVAYHAHSSGYGFGVPPGVPILAVSRNTLGYWGDQAPGRPLLLVPNALDPSWLDRGHRHAVGTLAGGARRPIDVLVQQRKSSRYVLDVLVPALRARGLAVEVQSGWVEDLVDLFNRATVVLYDSAEYWRGRGVSEGFGLPPIEALARGCVVFSSLNHALADTIDPGLVGHQIGCGTLASDLDRISAAVAEPEAWFPLTDRLESLLADCSEASLSERWRAALEAVNLHWDRVLEDGERPLKPSPRWSIRWSQRVRRLEAALLRRRR